MLPAVTELLTVCPHHVILALNVENLKGPAKIFCFFLNFRCINNYLVFCCTPSSSDLSLWMKEIKCCPKEWFYIHHPSNIKQQYSFHWCWWERSMLCNSCFPPPLHQLWPLLGNRQAVKLVFFAFCISNFEFVFCTNRSCKEHSILYFEFLQFLFSSTFAPALVLTGELPSSKAFAFWILYFAFCILYFAFCIFSSPLHQLWPLLGIRQAVKLCFFGTSPIQQWN